MTAADRLTRLLALVPWLVTNSGVTVRECAEHFGVSEKQLADDLFLLIVSGDEVLGAGGLVDIQFWTDDEEGEPRVDADATIEVVQAQGFERPMRLSPAEAMSLLVALRMLGQLPGVADHDTIASVVAKLEAATSQSASAPAAGEIAVEVAVDPAVRVVVDDALATGAEISLTYAAATTGAITERQVVPYGVRAVDGIAYLDAFCRFAGARRSFRLDRIVTAEVVPPADPLAVDDAAATAAPTTPEPGDAAEPNTPRLSAVLDLDAASRWVGEAHGGVVVDERPDGGVRVRLALHDLEWAVRLVLSQGGGAVVVEPPDLAQAVADAARTALAAYPGS